MTTPNAPTAREPLSSQERYRMHDAFLATAMKWHQRGNTTWYLEPEYVNAMFDAVFTAALLAARREGRALRDALEWIDKEASLEVLYAGGEGYLAFANRLKARARAALAATQAAEAQERK